MGTFDRELEQSKRLMKRDGVELSREARKLACEVMVQALKFHGVEVLALCVAKREWHALIRCPKKDRRGRDVEKMLIKHVEKSLGTAGPRLWRNRVARHFMGIAKKESARVLSRAKLVDEGGVSARGCGVKPIKNRKHQVKVVKYIRDHLHQGAIVWLWFHHVD